MMPSSAPTAVVFDFYGTLTVGASLEERDAARHAVAHVLRIDSAVFAAAIKDSFDARARGRTGDPIATLRWLANRCGVDPSEADVDRSWQRRLAVERTFMDPRPETLEVLRALRQAGLRAGVLSDCTHELPLCWPDLPFREFLHAVVFSVETGIRKPDPAMYAEICRRLGVAAADCVYVGDGGSNELTGARSAGMRAIQLRAPEFDTAHTYDAEPSWDGDVITDLRELYAVVGIDVDAARSGIRR